MAYSKKQIEDTFQAICDRIKQGESLRAVLRNENMPSSRTFFKWIQSDSEKVKQYAYVCEQRADAIFEEIIEIADNSANDTKVLMDGKVVTDNDVVQRSRLRIDARKWMLGKLNPTKYGDKTNLTIEDKRLTESERKAKIEELMRKAKGEE